MVDFKEKLRLLPERPGCYLMKDINNQIIYVGKAKVLKNRVKSYFTGSHNIKTQRLVSEIVDFEFIVTNSEVEALILENNLIKKHNPKYNILLKDDKQYPYLKITNEEHPRLLVVRSVKKDGSKYFGPYPNASVPTEIKKILDRIYPLRKCDVLPKRECLYYHLGQCMAPCIKVVTKEENVEVVAKITKFLKGDTKELETKLSEKMNIAAENLDFESAKEIRDQLTYLDKLKERQTMDSKDLGERDVFGFYAENGWICIQTFFIRNGKLIEREVDIFSYHDTTEDAFNSFIGQFYDGKTKPKEILVPDDLDIDVLTQYLDIRVINPKKGDKKTLLDLANKNARLSLMQKLFLLDKKEENELKPIEDLGTLLGIDTPKRIEIFDNSNIQGVDPVSAMVIYINGKPSKRDYRKFKLKTVVGPDDYESMREVIRRRYSRVLKENLPLPDLILVDGGKGQHSSALDVLENELGLNIPVFGMAKDDRHKTSHLVGGEPQTEIMVPKQTPVFYFLERIQDEVHRFAITFFRQTHSKTTFKSSLDDIDGIGEKRKKLLLKHFGSLDKIKQASIDELRVLGIPQKIAESILKTLNK